MSKVIERFHTACQSVLDLKRGGIFLEYAQAYAKTGLTLAYEGFIADQCLYIISNLKGSSQEMKVVRDEFKQIRRLLA